MMLLPKGRLNIAMLTLFSCGFVLDVSGGIRHNAGYKLLAANVVGTGVAESLGHDFGSGSNHELCLP